MSAVLRCLLGALAVVLLLAPSAAGAGRVDHLTGRMQVGIFSPEGQAAAERRRAPFGLRYRYLTSGVGNGTLRAPGSPGARVVTDWLRESAAAGMVPVTTYYQLQPSAPSGREEVDRVASALRSRATMRAYWRDARDALKLMGAERGQRPVFQIEPDGWQYFEQLQGLRTRAQVGATGLPELRGLPNDVRGFARAFVRLRDRHAPNVALAFHLSAWGVGQAGRRSVQNSEDIGRLRARFVARLGARFDLVTHDPDGDGIDAQSHAEHLGLLRTFHAATRLPVILFQVPADNRVAWLLGSDPAARAHLAAERAVGVVGMLFDGGTPDRPSAGRTSVFALAADAYAAGRLG